MWSREPVPAKVASETSKAAGEGARATQTLHASTGAPVATGNFASCQAPNPPMTFTTF